ncbi:MAG: glycerophosphodiester phosphodiesterase [Propionibacteriaceae bacterium]|nr:glycerophosphodiester phosphodiesterase [Propionibacteriaceae bacterium]
MYADKYPYCSPTFVAMAHRGGALYPPNLGKENTLHAFEQAVDLGYRYVETDVQATSDGQLVCFHDDTLERMTSVSGKVSDFTADQLREIMVDRQPIPFFHEVVEAFPHVKFNVDLKTDNAVIPLVRLISRLDLADRILVDSFSQRRISQFRSLTSNVPTAMAPPGVAWTTLAPGLSTLISSPGVALQVPITSKVGPLTLQVISPETIRRVHQMGKVIHAWTIDDPHEMECLIDWGIDGIITDRPDVLKDVLIRRNLWENQ